MLKKHFKNVVFGIIFIIVLTLALSACGGVGDTGKSAGETIRTTIEDFINDFIEGRCGSTAMVLPVVGE